MADVVAVSTNDSAGNPVSRCRPMVILLVSKLVFFVWLYAFLAVIFIESAE